MNKDTFSRLTPLCPADFFSLSVDIPYAKMRALPDTSELLAEESFAQIELAWKETGIQIEALVEKPFEGSFLPDFAKGDCLELFFDTRDLKTSGFMTRFCHHFLIFPQPVQEISAQEITHFRTEDVHPLCDPSEILVSAHFERKRYRLEVSIPAECLHGYDPASFDRLGFTYRLNRCGGFPQHFAVSSHYYALDQHPALWPTLKLVKK
jgi:hypothetical protein